MELEIVPPLAISALALGNLLEKLALPGGAIHSSQEVSTLRAVRLGEAWPAFHATRFCIRFALSPNMVTWASLFFVLLALWAFWQGHYLSGLAAGWLMTFLDTVDGKLARITLTASKFGNALDHGIDLVHPPFWYVAWCLGLAATPLALSNELFYGALAVILGGYLVQRVMEGLSILLFKIEIHVWRPIDTLFRQVTARRNPNLVLLTAPKTSTVRVFAGAGSTLNVSSLITASVP